MRTEGFNCSTFRFNQEGNAVMHTDSNYRLFCLHVRKIITVVCGVEILLICLLIWDNKYPLTICHSSNSSLQQTPNLRSPFQQSVHEQPSCTSISPILIFTVFHAIFDFITLIGIMVRRQTLILPLLILLVVNVIISVLFLLNSSIAYLFTKSKYDFQFVLFVFGQAIVRVYEFICARRLYWYFKFDAEGHRYMPQSQLLKMDEDDVFFQF